MGNFKKFYFALIIVAILSYIILPKPFSEIVGTIVGIIVIAMTAKIVRSTTTEDDLQLIKKLDWRIFLPIGILFLVFSLRQPDITPDSWTIKLAVIILGLGVVNIFSKFIFRPPQETFLKEYNVTNPTLIKTTNWIGRILWSIAGLIFLFFLFIMAIIIFHKGS